MVEVKKDDKQDQETVLITICQKGGRLYWKAENNINPIAIEQILMTCAKSQERLNTKSEIIRELNKPQIVKPTNAQIIGMKN